MISDPALPHYLTTPGNLGRGAANLISAFFFFTQYTDKP